MPGLFRLANLSKQKNVLRNWPETRKDAVASGEKPVFFADFPHDAEMKILQKTARAGCAGFFRVSAGSEKTGLRGEILYALVKGQLPGFRTR
jgi:hypothetical protein